MFSYWRGLPGDGRFTIGLEERASLSTSPCEDHLSILILGCEPELARGDTARRQRQFLAGLRDSFSRLTRPRSDLLTPERRERWFGALSS